MLRLLSMSATTAFAQNASPFTGPRIGVLIGSSGEKLFSFDNETIGIDGGYDFDVGGFVVGIGAEYQTDLGRDFFDINETALLARVGAVIGSSALLYATGGYTRISTGATPFGKFHEGGYRIGGGLEFALGGGGTSIKVEQRYFNYGRGLDGYQTVAGLSFRFGGGGVREEMAPPPPPPSPPTQTCADGSVILATDACPAPPPPMAEPERG